MAISKLSTGAFSGLSSDPKPVKGVAANPHSGANYSPAPNAGDRFVETDTGQAYVFTGENWVPVQ